MKIAVYSIAKNEEQFVARWADSAKEADGLFILDTGSTDRTVDIAAAHGVHVKYQKFVPWRFDVARNASLDMIPEDFDICIALDLDEVLVPGWRQHLEKINPMTTRPRYVYTWSWTEDGNPGLQYKGDKIHRRLGYRWKHPVHEVITPTGMEVQEDVGLEIHHFPDQTKSRGQYFPLLELAVEEEPNDDRNVFYLGREYFYHGMYGKAAVMLKRHLELSKWPAERATGMRYLSRCEPDHRLYWLLHAVAEAPDRREPWVDLAGYWYEERNWPQCYAAALEALCIREKPLEYLCEDFAWGAQPYDFAALSAYHMGMRQTAVLYGTEAVRLNPDDERLANNLKFYQEMN